MTNIQYFYSGEIPIDIYSAAVCFYTSQINSKGFIKVFLVVHKEPSKISWFCSILKHYYGATVQLAKYNLSYIPPAYPFCHSFV